jgi:hypothetical protein
MAKTTVLIDVNIGAQVPPTTAWMVWAAPFPFDSGNTLVLPAGANVKLVNGQGSVEVDGGVWIVTAVAPGFIKTQAWRVPESETPVQFNALVEETDKDLIGFGPTWAARAELAALSVLASVADASRYAFEAQGFRDQAQSIAEDLSTTTDEMTAAHVDDEYSATRASLRLWADQSYATYDQVAEMIAAALGDTPDIGYDVVLIAGQSNAQGAAIDFTPGVAPDTTPSRSFQFGATAAVLRDGAGTITPATDPLIQRFTQSTVTMGPGISFAREYVKTMPAGRKLLLVPAAYSGTGFTKTNHGTENSTHWRPGDNTGVNLYESAIAQTLAAIAAAGSNARLKGIIWVQGEADEAMAAATYQGFLDSLIAGFRTRLSSPDLPFIIGGMVPEGLAAVPGRAAIANVQIATPARVAHTSYVPGNSGNYIDSGLHYNALGQRTLGAALYNTGLPAAIANSPAPPAQVTGLVVGSVGSTSVSLSWTSIPEATSYVVERKPSSGSVWATTQTVTSPAAVETGLTGSTAYDFRVHADNSGGSGAVSSVVSGTTIATGSLLGDLPTPAAHAYGVRKLHAGYSGPAIQVRRTSDNTTTDISFDGSGNLDTTAMLTFAGGSGSLFVTKFYDLTGNGLHLSQATTSAQARIVNAGAVDVVNARPAAVANVNSFYSNTFAGPGLYSAGASSVCEVTAGTATANGRSVSETSSTSLNPQYAPVMANTTTAALLSQRITDNAGGSVAADVGTVAAFSASAVQLTVVDNGSSFVKRANGADAGTVAYTRAGTLTLDTFTWGGLYRNGAFGAGIGTRLMELIVWRAALGTTDRNTVEANQKSYYGTP